MNWKQEKENSNPLFLLRPLNPSLNSCSPPSKINARVYMHTHTVATSSGGSPQGGWDYLGL